jgi:hypothetical protein
MAHSFSAYKSEKMRVYKDVLFIGAKVISNNLRGMRLGIGKRRLPSLGIGIFLH